MNNKSAIDVDVFHTANDAALFSQPIIAEVLGCSESTLERHRQKNTGIKFVKIGNKNVRYRKRDVLDYIESQNIYNSKYALHITLRIDADRSIAIDSFIDGLFKSEINIQKFLLAAYKKCHTQQEVIYACYKLGRLIERNENESKL